MGARKNVNENFFKKWDRDMAYIAGFIFADGSITKNKRGGYYLSLYSADRELLVGMKEKMASDHLVAKRSTRSGNVYRIQIGSKEIVGDLEKIGLHETKVLRMKFPAVPKKYLSDFVRGFFDGDGNVWVGHTHTDRDRPTIGILTAFTSASKDFLRGLHSVLRESGLSGGSLFDIKGKHCGRLCFSKKDSLKLYDFMYNRAVQGLFLERKKRVFKRYIDLKNEAVV